MLFIWFLLFCSFDLSQNISEFEVIPDDKKPSFTIDYENNRFLLDGRPYRYISGSIHYFRIPQEYWRHRLAKLAAAGLNAIEFYIPWNFHEVFPGRYDFSGRKNVTRFIEIANEFNLKVLLRAGPYVCGEWENGGLPWWLLLDYDVDAKGHSPMRTHDQKFLQHVQQWYSVLFPIIAPLLRKNGGPILMVQVENEYGSYYGCDRKYTVWLRDTFRAYFGNDTLLYTTDGGSFGYLKCGFIPGVYPTVDFGPSSNKSIKGSFSAQRHYARRGPLVNSEFYPGWLTLWGDGRNPKLPSPAQIVRSADFMYKLGASFNFYMFHGGTNFEYWNGAETNAPVVTSYDYFAPISEAGDLTAKYYAIRDMIGNFSDWPYKPSVIPPATRKFAYGNVPVRKLGTILQLKDKLKHNCNRSQYPLTFEQMYHPYGFVLYETVLKFNGGNLSAAGLKDRGYVMVNGSFQGKIIHHYRNSNTHNINISGKIGEKLSILVENRGRLTYETINDFKGLTSNITLDGRTLTDWSQCGIRLENVFKLAKRPKRSSRKRTKIDEHDENFVPTVFVGKFFAKTFADTFLDSSNWGKGQFLLNEFNVGRYWPLVGPQISLFTPKTLLKAQNSVVLFELEQPGLCSNSQPGKWCIRFGKEPISIPINPMQTFD